ncbi:hypothetical protein [Sulfurovum sp.]|uniref:hypothetical protein n=1 Tax=Sulfurovum sp. TaxID=1969726 RepID=UPI003566805E
MKELQSLYNRAYQLAQEAITNKEDMKELAGEFTYDKEYNTDGFEKDNVKEIINAAVAKAKSDDLQGKADKLKKLQEIQEMYS